MSAEDQFQPVIRRMAEELGNSAFRRPLMGHIENGRASVSG